MSEHKEPIPSMIYNASVGGHVTNSQQIIDENLNREQQDINEEVAAVPYNVSNPNGMGRIVLKKNDNFKQVVEAQTNGNTIFVIKYDFILTDNVTIPANCVLEFDGGSITGGNIDFNNCRIIASELPILDGITPYNLPIINVAWFGILPTNDDNSTKLNALFSSFSSNYDYTKRVIIKFNHGKYKINSTLIVPKEASGFELWGVDKDANGKTTIYSENENIDCLLLLKNQTSVVSCIKFEGYGTTWDTDHYTKIVTGIRCKRADNYIPNNTWDNDNIFDTESTIKNCSFFKLHTGIECWGRHNTIQHNGFSVFVIGISFNCIEPYGLVQGGGPVRNNYVENNNFHADISDRAQRAAEPRRGCIVVDNIHCDNLYISGNRNTSWNKLFYGYLVNSMITNNYSCWSLTDKLIHVLEANGAFINGNWLYYNNTYQEFSGEGLTPIERGAQQGIYFEGNCISSQIINNVIMRYSQEGAIVFKGNTNFCLISNNYCYYSENTPSSTDDIIYAIVFGYTYNSNNVIINNINICNRGANTNLSNKFTVVDYVTLDSPEYNFINNNIALGQSNRGRSAYRPSLDGGNSALNSELGFEYFDQELGIPIYWNGSKWIKADGTDANA